MICIFCEGKYIKLYNIDDLIKYYINYREKITRLSIIDYHTTYIPDLIKELYNLQYLYIEGCLIEKCDI